MKNLLLLFMLFACCTPDSAIEKELVTIEFNLVNGTTKTEAYILPKGCVITVSSDHHGGYRVDYSTPGCWNNNCFGTLKYAAIDFRIISKTPTKR